MQLPGWAGRPLRGLAAAGLGLLAILAIGPASAAPVTDEIILNGENDTHNVVTYGIGLRGQRFSKLSSINSSNVKDLVPVWSFSFGGEKQHEQEAQPLVVDGVIYTTASYSRLFAVDARTGRKLWEYDAPLPDGITYAIRPFCPTSADGLQPL